MSDMISIIIPAYNAADYLAQTIESVLNQTYSDFELILIDDGSTDRTREIIKDYQCKDARIKYFYKENGGVSSARNLGLQKATGDFVSFLDSDDLWDRRFLELMYHKLVAGGELACLPFLSPFIWDLPWESGKSESCSCWYPESFGSILLLTRNIF